MAVVVGAPDVNDLIEAADLELVAVVGDVAGEIGVEAVGAAQHVVLQAELVDVLVLLALLAVLVAHDLRGLDPERAVLFVGPAEVGELFRRVGDKAGLVQGGLEEPFVELDAVALKVALHLGDVAVEAEARHIGVALRLGLVQIALAVLGVERLRKLLDVVAVVAVLGELDGVLALDELEVAGLDALGELFDLVAKVVDIELTPHVRAGPVEHARERVAEHAAAGVAHVHGAGGVGGDELDHVLLALEALAAAVGVRLALHVLNDVGVPLFAETEVQEAGAGDLNRSKVGAVELHVLGEDIRDLARVLAHGLGGGQAEGGGVVAVGGILGDLDRGDGLHAIGQQTLLHGGAVGAARQGGDLVLCALDHIHSFFPRSFVVDAATRCRAAKVQNRNVYYTTAVCGKQAVFAISAAKAGAFLCRRTRNSACTDSAALI